MSPDFTVLADLAKNPERATAGHQPLTRDMLAQGKVLAFDQSLMATGWAKIVNDETSCRVVEAGVIKGGPGTNSIETNLVRGACLFDTAMQLMWVHGECDVVHESPPNPSQVKGGGYSSLLAAQTLRCAAMGWGREITMLGAQPAKKLVSGQVKDKRLAHEALKRDCFPWIVGSEKITNEALRDACLIALLHLSRKRTR